MKPSLLLPILATTFTAHLAAQTPAAEPTAPAPTSPAPQVILTPAQTANILKQLEQIESQIGQGRTSILSAALTKFRAAMGSANDALGLYLDCIKLEDFERKDLKQTDFMDWRDKNEARLKDEDFTTGLLLQLEYLVMTIQAQDVSEISKMGPMVTALQAFIAKEIAAIQNTTKHTASGAVEAKDNGKGGGGGRQGGGRQGGGGGGPGGQLASMLRQSVKNTEFSKAYLLEDHLTRRDWQYAPLDVGGIYSSIIFPYYLSEKPTELAAQWDARINADMAIHKAMRSETEFAIYFKEENPRLQWAKNNFLVTNNVNAVNALADLLKVIRDNPSHPDAASWLGDFRQLVKSASEPEPGPVPTEKPIGSQQ